MRASGFGIAVRRELASGTLTPALATGATSGLGLLVTHVAFATLIFSGPLAPHVSQGVGLMLFGTFAGCLVIALTGGFRGAISGLSPALVIVMAYVASTMETAGAALFPTTVVALAIGAAGTGALCVLVGRLGLANLVRFIPYPVAAGFIGGIGGAVCLAAMSMMGVALDWRSLGGTLEPAALLRWAPGALYGIGLYLAMRRFRNPLVLPLSVVLFVGGYQVVLPMLGMSGQEARDAGILFASTSEGALWPAVGLSDLALVDWTALTGQIPDLLVLALVALIVIVMGLAGLEVATGEDLDWDREFRAAGSASVVGGLGGGTFVCMIVPASFRSKLFGASTRLTGVVCALVLGAALFGDRALEFVPVSLIGGVLIFAGLGMLEEGLLRGRRRLPWSEYGIVLLIFVMITAFGLIEGVATGMLATLVFFALRLSRVDPVASSFTGGTQRSNRVRPPPERALLRERGDRIHGYRLRGYLFFGSAWPLADRLKQSLEGAEPPACLILDLRAVSGFDFSAVNVLSRFLQTASAAGVRVVLSGASESLEAGLARNVAPAVLSELGIESSEDRALERCEDLVVEAWEAEAAATADARTALLMRSADDLERYLERQERFEELVEELAPWVEPRTYAAGESLTGERGDARELQLLVAGRATACDAAGARLEQCTRGDAVWPAGGGGAGGGGAGGGGAAGGRAGATASVVADESCRTVALNDDTWRWLEEHEASLALKLYRYLFASRLAAQA